MSAIPASAPQLTPFTRVMRILYVIVAWILAICILIQVFLAGLSIFVSPALISLHITFVHFFEGLPLLLLIFALCGRFSRSIPLLSLVLIVQIALQYAFIRLSGQLGTPIIAAFHPVNAVVMFWIAQYVARRATHLLK